MKSYSKPTSLKNTPKKLSLFLVFLTVLIIYVTIKNFSYDRLYIENKTARKDIPSSFHTELEKSASFKTETLILTYEGVFGLGQTALFYDTENDLYYACDLNLNTFDNATETLNPVPLYERLDEISSGNDENKLRLEVLIRSVDTNIRTVHERYLDKDIKVRDFYPIEFSIRRDLK